VQIIYFFKSYLNIMGIKAGVCAMQAHPSILMIQTSSLCQNVVGVDVDA
jgi:hypothetical protein